MLNDINLIPAAIFSQKIREQVVITGAFSRSDKIRMQSRKKNENFDIYFVVLKNMSDGWMILLFTAPGTICFVLDFTGHSENIFSS